MVAASREAPCPRHPEELATGQCGFCGKPICRECMRAFGYYCSEECLGKSKNAISHEERESAEEAKQAVKSAAKMGRIMVLAVVVLFVFGGAFVAWKLFLDKTGKVCWTWDCSADFGKLSVIGSEGGKVWIRANDQIVAVNGKNGKQVSSFKLERGQGFFEEIKLVSDGILVWGDEKLTCLGLDGGRKYVAEFNGRRMHLAVAQDKRQAFVAVNPPAVMRLDLPEGQEQKKKRLFGLDLAKGGKLWTKKLKDKVGVAGMASGTNKLFCVFTKATATFKYDYVFCTLDGDSGKRLWRIDLPEQPGWGPVAWKDTVLLQVEGEIHAFSGTGEEVWSVPVEGDFPSRGVKDGMFFLGSPEGTTCYDMGSGKELWKTDLAVSSGEMFIGRKRLFLVGYASDKAKGTKKEGEVKLPPAYEENKDILKDFGIDVNNMGKKKLVPVLACLDRKSGKEIWRKRNVMGRIFGDEHRLVQVMDTSQTSMLAMIGGGKGVTVIRQYDLGSGKMMYSRQSELGFRFPVLAGDRLVGISHERTEKPGLLNGMNSQGGGKLPKIKIHGIAAFKVK